MSFDCRTPTTGSGSTNQITINKPANTAEGDILFAWIVGMSYYPNSLPNGWATVGQAAATYYRALCYKVAGASEPSNYTFGFSGYQTSVGVICTFYGDAFDVQSIDDITLSNTTYTVFNGTIRAASMDVPYADSPLIWFGSNYIAGAITPPSSPGSGFTEDYDGAPASSIQLEVAHQVWSGSGSTGNMDGSCSSTVNKHAMCVALRPAGLPIDLAPGGTGHTLASASPALYVQKGWAFPAAKSDITSLFTRNDTFQEVDVSGVVPPGTTAIIMEVYNSGMVGGEHFAVRATGQPYDHTIDLYINNHFYCFVALDGDRTFECKAQSTNAVYLIGYTDANCFDPSPADISNTSVDSYYTKTAQNSGAMCLVELGVHSSANGNWALRDYGDTHDYYGRLDYTRSGATFGVVGIDGSKQFEHKISSTVVDLFDHGSVVDGIVDCSQGSYYPDITPGSTGWQTVDITSLVGSDAGKVVGAIVLAQTTSSTSPSSAINVRPYGDTTDSGKNEIGIYGLHFQWVGVDSQDRFEARIATTSFNKIYLVAYITGTHPISLAISGGSHTLASTSPTIQLPNLTVAPAAHTLASTAVPLTIGLILAACSHLTTSQSPVLTPTPAAASASHVLSSGSPALVVHLAPATGAHSLASETPDLVVHLSAAAAGHAVTSGAPTLEVVGGVARQSIYYFRMRT